MSRQFLDLYDDVIVLYRGDCLPVRAGARLRQTGWAGGTFVQFVPPTGVDEFEAERSDGTHVAGFILSPSENYNIPDLVDGAQMNFTAMQVRTEQGSVAGASTVTLMSGTGRLLFKRYETRALTANGERAGAPIVYHLNKPLYVSENGLLCNDPVDYLKAAGVDAQQVGICSAVPSSRNNYRLGLDMRL